MDQDAHHLPTSADLGSSLKFEAMDAVQMDRGVNSVLKCTKYNHIFLSTIKPATYYMTYYDSFCPNPKFGPKP